MFIQIVQENIYLSKMNHRWVRWHGMQSLFLFSSSLFSELEIRALCRSLKLIYTNLANILMALALCTKYYGGTDLASKCQ